MALMINNDHEVRCGGCELPISEEASLSVELRKPCGHCGSTARHFSMAIMESVALHEQFRAKQKRPGFKRPILETVSGDRYSHKSNRWAIIEP